MALTEMLDLFPIFIRRIRLVRGIGAIIIGIAFGKGLGALLFFLEKVVKMDKKDSSRLMKIM